MNNLSRLLAALALTTTCLVSVPVAASEGGGEGGGSSPYLALDPPFVTNLMDGNRMRFMQVKIQVAGDEKEIKLVQHHLPAVRDRVLLLLSDQKLEAIRNVQDREKLRQDCLAAIQAVMQERVGKPVVTAVYFTDFVVQ